MEITIALPRQFNGYSIAVLLNRLSHEWGDGPTPTKVVFDFAPLNFVRPSGVVFLSNICHWLLQKGCEVSFLGLDAGTPPIAFMDDALFFEQHCGQKINPAARPRTTTLPLRQIARQECHSWLRFTLLPWLSRELGINQASLYSTITCIAEIFNNIQDHTRFDIGSIFVQHFPRQNSIIISISDFGEGIPHVVRTKLPTLSDEGAILKAVEEGFTTKSTPNNQGAGLDYLLRTVVRENGGVVTIFSLGAIVSFSRNGTNVEHHVYQASGFCPGTTIDIEIKTDAIRVLPQETEDLQW